MSRWMIWGFGATVFAALLIALLLPGDVLSTRLVGVQRSVRIDVARGQLLTLPLVVQPSQQLILLCSDTWLRRETCVTVAGTVTGNQTVIVIPLTQPLGKVLLKVVAQAVDVSSQLQGRAFVNVSAQQPARSGPTVLYRRALNIVPSATRQETAPSVQREPDTGGGAPRGETRPDIPSSSLPSSQPATPGPSATPESTPGF